MDSKNDGRGEEQGDAPDVQARAAPHEQECWGKGSASALEALTKIERRRVQLPPDREGPGR